MTNNLPVTYTDHSAQKHHAIPLGTADWMRFKKGQKPTYKDGDLWLSRLPSGEPVGYSDDRHVLLVSGTRSGKGASVIIPNLCLWPGSAVVIDPKGENATVTARRRASGSNWSEGMGQKVHILDPFGEVCTNHDDFSDLMAAYNPLELIQANSLSAVDDAGRIAEALVVSEGGNDPYWEDSARGMLKALILHVASSPTIPLDLRNLVTLRQILVAGDEEMQRLAALNADGVTPSGLSLLFKGMQNNPAYAGLVQREGVALADMLEGSPRTLMSVVQVARTNTEFLDSPALQRCLQRSTFDIADIKTHRTTVYMCLPQRYMNTHYRWLRMMTTLILGEMERVRPTPAPQHPVLMVLDEFPALKRMKVVENAAAQIAGYGVKLMFVAQTLAQLKDTYKDNWETLVANAGVKLFFGNDDHFTREYAAKLMGEMELRRWGRSESKTVGTSHSESHGTNENRSGSYTRGSSSSIGGNDQGMSVSFGSSSSSTEGWSRGVSNSVSRGTNESETEGGSETFHKRYLLNPDEIGRIFGDRSQPAMLALISGMKPLALKRTMYFSDRQFAGKFDPHRDHAPPNNLQHVKLLEAKRQAVIKAEADKKRAQQDAARDAARAIQQREALRDGTIHLAKRSIQIAIQLGFVASVIMLVMQFL